MYNSIMLKGKCDRQTNVYVYSKKDIVCEIISKRVLEAKICEKYKINDILVVSQIKIFGNTSISLINAARMNMTASNFIFKHQ